VDCQNGLAKDAGREYAVIFFKSTETESVSNHEILMTENCNSPKCKQNLWIKEISFYIFLNNSKLRRSHIERGRCIQAGYKKSRLSTNFRNDIKCNTKLHSGFRLVPILCDFCLISWTRTVTHDVPLLVTPLLGNGRRCTHSLNISLIKWFVCAVSNGTIISDLSWPWKLRQLFWTFLNSLSHKIAYVRYDALTDE